MSGLIVDFDDFHEGNSRFDLLYRLKDANPRFKATLFSIPARGSQVFWCSVPDWLELALHGFEHPHPNECGDWSYERALHALRTAPAGFVKGWKSPGWQISDGTYRALLEEGWWVADKAYNNHRRPAGLLHHLDGESVDSLEHWHGHIQNVFAGHLPGVIRNGLEESFPLLLEKVSAATEFRFISEVVHA